MIHLSSTPVENNTDSAKNNNLNADWQALLSQCKMSTQELLSALHLDQHPLASSQAEELFELRVPKPYLEKIEKGNPKDPLLLQILPQKSEYETADRFSPNPLNEGDYTPVKGLIHKYKSRVLLISSATCAINCRYCFRRTFPYVEHRQSKADWQDALNYIRNSPELNEVILSGGDPLINGNDYLFWLLSEVDAIEHIKRIRIHSRLITSLPQRIDSGFIAGIQKIRADTIIVTHCNHPNEIDHELKQKLALLKACNVTLLNQSVLLKDINDSADTLRELSESLFNEIGRAHV